MGGPEPQWIPVAWFSDEGSAQAVSDYLKARGLRAKAHAPASRAVGDAPVFVIARDADLARRHLRRLATRDFPGDPDEGSLDWEGAQLAEQLAPSAVSQPPSSWMLWVPILFVAAACLLYFGFLAIVSLMGEGQPAPSAAITVPR